MIKGQTEEDTAYIWVKGMAEFQPPAQAKNTVELPYLNQQDGITYRVKGSRAGGEISGTLNARNDEDSLNGLAKMLEAYEDQDGDYTLKWMFPNGAYAIVEFVKITDCSLQGGSLDTAVSYAVSAVCNSKVKYFKSAASSQSASAQEDA